MTLIIKIIIFVTTLAYYLFCFTFLEFTDYSSNALEFDVRFKGLTVMKIQVEVFWNMMLCSVMVGHQLSGGPCCLKMKAERSSEMLVSYCNTTQHFSPELGLDGM
jgi:hypothetical protein